MQTSRAERGGGWNDYPRGKGESTVSVVLKAVSQQRNSGSPELGVNQQGVRNLPVSYDIVRYSIGIPY